MKSRTGKALLLGVLLGTSLLSPPVAAQVSLYNVKPQGLEEALFELAEKAQLSLNLSEVELKGIVTQGTRGRLSRSAALRALLDGSGLDFKFTGENSVVIFKAAPQNTVAGTPAPEKKAPLPGFYIEDLIVTASKRPEATFHLPISVTGVSALTLEDLDTYDMQSLAPHLAGVTTTNLGPGRNKIFIRGMSDGPFADRTQTMVGVYIDETPVNLNDTNPDIRLFDVERVEVVRGPQGTLYGAGSMGGLYRIITNKAELDDTNLRVRLGTSFTKDGGQNGQLDFVFNMPIVRDTLGFRVTGYADLKDGYIDNVETGENNVNNLEILGLRPSVRWRVNDNWSVDAAFNYQAIRYHDSQYYRAEFGRNKIDNPLPEPYEDDFLHGSLNIKGQIGSIEITSASAIIDRTNANLADATYGLPDIDGADEVSGAIFVRGDLAAYGDLDAFDQLFESDAVAYITRNDIHTISHETRLRSADNQRIEWLLGGLFLRRSQAFGAAIVLAYADKEPVLAISEARKEVNEEYAGFSEIVYHLNDKWEISGGLRYSRNYLDLNYTSLFVLDGDNSRNVTGSKLTEKVIGKAALRYQPSDDIQFYALTSAGYRVGGINIDTPLEALIAADPDKDFNDQFQSTFQSDNLINYELGVKSYWLGRSLSLNLAAFYMEWFDIQSDQIGTSGLPFVTNVGNARNLGYEVEFSARLFPGFDVRGSFFWNDSELTDDNAFLGAQKGDHLPTIPENTASIAALYQFDLSTNWRMTLSADYSYVGESSLGFNEETSPKMGKYGIANAKMQISSDVWKIGLFAKNLTDTNANTFSFGNSFTVTEGDQITPPRPRTFGLFLERKF